MENASYHMLLHGELTYIVKLTQPDIYITAC